MTSRTARGIAQEHFGQAWVEKSAILEGLRAELPPPRELKSLVEEAGPLGIGRGHLVADVGAGTGRWSPRLRKAYDCRCIAVDVSHVALQRAREKGTASVVADADCLPFENDSVDAIWCRDMLSMVEDPAVVLAEYWRVLRRGGGLLLYTAVVTEKMEPREKAEFISALEAFDWWARGREPIETAITLAGFEIVGFRVTSPEYTEGLLLNEPDEVVQQLLEHAQLRRGGDVMRSALGPDWYERFLAWSRWQMYLSLGKLETCLWLLRKQP